MKKFLLTIFSAVCTLQVFATDTPPAGKAKEVKETKEEDGKFSFSGYMDTYFFANFNSPQDRYNIGVNGGARAFDQRAGQFGVGLVQTKATYSSSKVDAVFDLAFGPFADLGNYGNTFSLNTGAATSTSLAIKQAYITLKASDKFTITAGQFGTHIGYEVIDAPVNYNYSLSNLFNNGPFYHVGVKAQYAFSDKAYLMVGLVNNVDLVADNNRAKGVIAQLFVSPAKGWNVYLNTMVSNEANVKSNGKDSTGSYAIYDLTTTYQITDKFLVGLNAVTGWQTGGYQQGNPYFTGTYAAKSTNWGGVALYSNYAFTDKFGLGIRYDFFDNTGGTRALVDASGNGTMVKSFTLTSNITCASGHVLLKPELRIDSYNHDKFVDGDGKLQKSQATLGMAAIFKF
ncbi:MAG: porin [Spirosomataceae bacterium]